MGRGNICIEGGKPRPGDLRVCVCKEEEPFATFGAHEHTLHEGTRACSKRLCKYKNITTTLYTMMKNGTRMHQHTVIKNECKNTLESCNEKSLERKR